MALYVEVLTDNRNRSGSEIRTLLTKNGGSLAEPGAVAWQFERKGVVIVPRSVDEDELMLVALDAGAEDLADEGDTWRVTTGPSDLPAVREALEAGEVPFESADLTMLPSSTVELASAEDAKAVLRLIDLLGRSRRRPGRLRQLRHPRRGPASRQRLTHRTPTTEVGRILIRG